jgi:septal ring factor EnvC (AmiA/AmiB activator)
MPDSMHEVSRVIGDLEATVRSFKETWATQDREATDGRRRLHDKIDSLKSQQEALASTVSQQTKKFAEIEPAIKRFEIQRRRQEGARSLAKLLWGGVVAFAAGLGYLAHEMLILFWPPKGH